MDPSKIYLAQTDTTVGLCSQNAEALAAVKGRSPEKPFLVTCAGLRELKKLTRVPKKHRKTLRRAEKTTFVYPGKNIAIRVVHSGDYYEFLKKFGWMYSTSANRSGGNFDFEFANSVADVLVMTGDGYKEGAPSKIIRLGKKLKKLR